MTSPSNYLALTQQLSTSQRGIHWFSCRRAPYAEILLTEPSRTAAGQPRLPDLAHSTWENASLLIASDNRTVRQWAAFLAMLHYSEPESCPGRISNWARTDGDTRVKSDLGLGEDWMHGGAGEPQSRWMTWGHCLTSQTWVSGICGTSLADFWGSQWPVQKTPRTIPRSELASRWVELGKGVFSQGVWAPALQAQTFCRWMLEILLNNYKVDEFFLPGSQQHCAHIAHLWLTWCVSQYLLTRKLDALVCKVSWASVCTYVGHAYIPVYSTHPRKQAVIFGPVCRWSGCSLNSSGMGWISPIMVVGLCPG
jgi:hypothetical protein